MKCLEEILKSIPDIIKVYKPDGTIAFYNEACYRFYGNTPKEVEGKKYYEVILWQEKYIEGCLKKVLETKEIIGLEEYIPRKNKYMDICFNPVLDEAGEIIYIVERLRDITEKKILYNILNDSKNKYEEVISNSPEAIVIIEDNTIALANNEAGRLVGVDSSQLIGKSIYNYFPAKVVKALRKKVRDILKNKKTRIIHEYKIHFKNKKIDAQICSSYLLYNMKPAIQASISDVTKMKKDLNQAAAIQKKSLQDSFPISGKVNMEKVYVAAHTVSGDFFRIYKVNNDLAIGIIVDVSGNGITAAMSISALEVLFNEEVSSNHKPLDILNNLNKKIFDYFGENYIAACCFSMDFKSNEIRVAGAGINQFAFQRCGDVVEEGVVKGSFLGMFENSLFDEKVIQFKKGDRFFFFTDGLEFILDKDGIIQRYMGKATLAQFKKYLDEFLNDTLIETGNLSDDCMLLGLEIL